MQLGTVTVPFYLLVTAKFPFASFSRVDGDSDLAMEDNDLGGFRKFWEVTVYGSERGKRDVYYGKQVEKVVTVLNCMLKGLWEEVESGGIRKKLKSKYTACLESKFRRNDRGLI